MPTLGAKDYSCAVSCYGQVFTDKFLLKSFFFLAASPLMTSACDRHRTIQQQARKKSLVPRVSNAVQLAETGQGRLALMTNKRFEISAFMSFHVEQFISSTQADKNQFLSAKLIRACSFYFVSLFNRHVSSCRHCCHNNWLTSAR